MKPAGYVLTGLNKYRNRSHSPRILDYSLTHDWFGLDEKEAVFPNQEHLNVLPITRLVLIRLVLSTLEKRRRRMSVDDFWIWQPIRLQGATILCTRTEFRIYRYLKAIRRFVHKIVSVPTL